MENKLKNKLLITKEKGYIISSMFEDDEMVEVDLYPHHEEETILGNIYIGKVQNIVKNINAAFVEIEDGLVCYLSLAKAKNPIYTNDRTNKNGLAIGDELLVQVSKERIKTKAPVVSVELNFTGKYAVLIHGNSFVGISSKIRDPKKRDEIKRILKPYVTEDYGFIARTNSAIVEEERLLKEVEILKNQYEKVRQFGIYKNRFSLVYEAPSGYICDIRDSNEKKLDEIVTDIPIVYDKVKKHIKEYQPEDCNKLRLYTDEHLSLSNLYGIKSKLHDLLKEKVWLKSGGSIIIQVTEALTAIDVNTSKAIRSNKKNPEKNFFKINMEAAKEIARQIRLRNLSGIIIIDFIDMKEQKHKDMLLDELRKLFAKDPIKTVLVGMTALNLVEVTRKKIRKPLYEQVYFVDS